MKKILLFSVVLFGLVGCSGGQEPTSSAPQTTSQKSEVFPKPSKEEFDAYIATFRNQALSGEFIFETKAGETDMLVDYQFQFNAEAKEFKNEVRCAPKGSETSTLSAGSYIVGGYSYTYNGTKYVKSDEQLTPEQINTSYSKAFNSDFNLLFPCSDYDKLSFDKSSFTYNGDVTIEDATWLVSYKYTFVTTGGLKISLVTGTLKMGENTSEFSCTKISNEVKEIKAPSL